MFVDSEVLMPPAGILVYRDTICRWQPPHQGEPLNASERERIMNNILTVLDSQGVQVQVL